MRVGLLLILFLISFSLSSCFSDRRNPAAIAIYNEQITGDGSQPFAAIGDTQRTLWGEKFFLRREVNDNERVQLLQSLLSEHPVFLVHLEDLTCDGSMDAEWDYFDALMAGFRSQNLPILPVFGNHDYWGKRSESQSRFEARFPELARNHWHVRTSGGLGLVCLDHPYT